MDEVSSYVRLDLLSLDGKAAMSPSQIGRSGSSAFRLSTIAVFDIARRLALLSGIGTKSLPSWGSKTGWNNLSGRLAVKSRVDTHVLVHPTVFEPGDG